MNVHRKTLYLIATLLVMASFNELIRLIQTNVRFSELKVQKEYQKQYQESLDPNGIWIHVTSYGDGFTCYTKAISQLLVLAKQMNATFVEPCILNGAFYPCDHIRIQKQFEKTSKPHLRLGDVYDMNLLREYHAKIVSFETFQNARLSALGALPHFASSGHKWEMSIARSNITTYQMCMAPMRLDCKDFVSFFDQVQIPIFDNVILDNTKGNIMTIIEIYNLRYQALNKYKDILDSANKMRQKHFRFIQEHYDIVDFYLKQLGVDVQNNEPFQAIQWRGELNDMDYMECARKIINAKDAMIRDRNVKSSDRKHPVTIVVSSINENTGTMW